MVSLFMLQTIIEGLSNNQDYNSWKHFTKKEKLGKASILYYHNSNESKDFYFYATPLLQCSINVTCSLVCSFLIHTQVMIMILSSSSIPKTIIID